MTTEQIDYKNACLYVGQFFLETRHQLEILTNRVIGLEADLLKTLKERDEALGLIGKKSG